MKNKIVEKVDITNIISYKVKNLKNKYSIDAKGNVYETDIITNVERTLKWHYKKLNTRYPYIIIRVQNDKEYILTSIKPYYFSVINLLAKAFLYYPIEKYGSNIRLVGNIVDKKYIYYPEMKYSNNAEYKKIYKKLSEI